MVFHTLLVFCCQILILLKSIHLLLPFYLFLKPKTFPIILVTPLHKMKECMAVVTVTPEEPDLILVSGGQHHLCASTKLMEESVFVCECSC